LRKLERKAGLGNSNIVIMVDDEGTFTARIGSETYSGRDGESKKEFEDRLREDLEGALCVMWLNPQDLKL